MPLIKSAIKRVRQSEKRQIRNRITKRQYKELVKNFIKHVKANEMKEAIALFPAMQKAIDMAVKKNILHMNTAGRKKSQLAKMISTTETKAAPKTETETKKPAVKKTTTKKAAPKK